MMCLSMIIMDGVEEGGSLGFAEVVMSHEEPPLVLGTTLGGTETQGII